MRGERAVETNISRFHFDCKFCDAVGMYRLYLTVDECLTTFRCGAFFTHQPPQYSDFRPSFIVFGKALATNGLAIWDGPTD